jgi:PKD repeat protein
MKRIVALMLLWLAVCNLQSKAQLGTTCNANFSFQFVNSNTVKFTPVVIGDSLSTLHTWSFGDGDISLSPAPVKTYFAIGTYAVTHVIVKLNPNGVPVCSDTAMQQVVIQSLPCTIQSNFTFYDSIGAPRTVQFINWSANTIATDSIRWTFGDGTSLQGLLSTPGIQLPTHTYANAGTYTVCLRIKRITPPGTAPCVSEFCKTVVVTQNTCNLVASFTSQPDPAHPLRIKFTNTSTSIAATDSVRWTFGDGTVINGLQSNSNVANPTHNYAQAGVYTVCLRIKKPVTTANTPCVKEICKTIVVEQPCNFSPAFSIARDSINPYNLHFANLSNVPQNLASAMWTFGDGSSAATWNATHLYTQPGRYIVCLKVTTDSNCVKVTCDTVVIVPTDSLCNNYSKFSYEVFSNDKQKCKFKPDVINAAVQYTWTFGDGKGSKDPIATHRYAQPGLYVVCLTAWRGPNCATTTCKEIRVLPQINCNDINVNYTWQRDTRVPNKIYFKANSNAVLLDQTWTITRLSPVTTPPVILRQNNPAYIFNDTGFYKVCLKAVTLGGCVKEYCNTIRIDSIAINNCLLQAYPNPASSVINVAVPLQQPSLITAYVYNASSVLVRTKQQQGVAGLNTMVINVNDLTPGLYTIKVMYEGKICFARFTKL